MNKIEKNALKLMIIFTLIGVGISYGINVALFSLLGDAAFPLNLIIIVSAFLVMGFFFNRRQLKKIGALGSQNQTSSMFYECLECHITYKGEKCWRCGSRGGKAVFG